VHNDLFVAREAVDPKSLCQFVKPESVLNGTAAIDEILDFSIPAIFKHRSWVAEMAGGDDEWFSLFQCGAQQVRKCPWHDAL